MLGEPVGSKAAHTPLSFDSTVRTLRNHSWYGNPATRTPQSWTKLFFHCHLTTGLRAPIRPLLDTLYTEQEGDVEDFSSSFPFQQTQLALTCTTLQGTNSPTMWAVVYVCGWSVSCLWLQVACDWLLTRAASLWDLFHTVARVSPKNVNKIMALLRPTHSVGWLCMSLKGQRLSQSPCKADRLHNSYLL